MFSPATPNLRRALLPCALLCACGVSGSAQTFGFNPTILNIDATKNLVTETVITNGTATPARFVVTPKLWRVVNGTLQLDDTRDLIVNPSSFTIKPGASQVIRIGVRKKPGETELTYRVYVQQEAVEGVALPTINTALGKDSRAALNVALSFSLPVYVTQPDAKANVSLTAARSGADVTLTVRNSGARRSVYRNVTVTRGSGAQSIQVIAALAGTTQVFTLSGLADASGPLTLRYVDENGQTRTQTIPVP
ncbi:fimbrial biogenesis chaperone [Deinococcus radiotolerans]|uniref:Pili assembly chaperone N-terminal domain-containing protein n=1 Tax=Deinococcus radiotolerans TaxID=1309407 RepID=A0ABQ2FKE1_9DEIO|nr:fimbria/pilus periplasmic chaperone [Deinococcus radiotolerans]GGL03016.1 hypothetical protein GCM10010844_22010 [Deinococcus radiotolerans]